MHLYTFLPDNLELKQLFPSFSIQSASSNSNSHTKSFSKGLFFFFCVMLWFANVYFEFWIKIFSVLKKYDHKLWGELVYNFTEHQRYFELLFWQKFYLVRNFVYAIEKSKNENIFYKFISKFIFITKFRLICDLVFCCLFSFLSFCIETKTNST